MQEQRKKGQKPVIRRCYADNPPAARVFHTSRASGSRLQKLLNDKQCATVWDTTTLFLQDHHGVTANHAAVGAIKIACNSDWSTKG
eukprot:scaffold22680_cov107-Cylindrotheca_fusiformis.AAC.7